MAGAAVMCRVVTEGVFSRKGADSSANQSDFNLGCVPGLITFDRPDKCLKFLLSFSLSPDAVMSESETPKVTTPIARSSRRARLRN